MEQIGNLFILPHAQSLACCVGYDGCILKTSNEGISWSTYNVGVPGDLQAVFFVNENAGWTCNYGYGNILKSTEGGSAWSVQTSNLNPDLRSIYFIDDQNGWIVGALGEIYNTEDGGTGWLQQTSPVSSQLNTIKFINESTGWIGGNSGVILKYCIANYINTHMYQNKDLLRIAPNPFTSNSNLFFKLPNKNRINIKIVNLFGDIIITLIDNEIVDVGTHVIIIDAKNIKPGVYFAQLQLIEKDISIIRKIIILK
jgi:hypothetical protein